MSRTRILSSWAGGGKPPHDPAPSPNKPAPSADVNPVHETELTAVAVCFTTRTLCEWLGISIRSWTRAAAMGLTPAPDLVMGRSPRWSPSTIQRWLRSKPRLPGRVGGHRGQ
jgi:hypothetical protein